MRSQHPHLQTLLDIPPDQLAVWPRSFWNGRTGVMDISYPEELSILITPHFEPSHIKDIHNVVYARCKSTPSPPPLLCGDALQHTLQETPHNLTTAMLAPFSSQYKTWCGLARIGTDSVLITDPCQSVPIRVTFFFNFLRYLCNGFPDVFEGHPSKFKLNRSPNRVVLAT